MLIAEDLLLMLLDDKSGKLTTNRGPWRERDPADDGIGGALLVELALGGHIAPVPWPHHKMPKVRTTDAPAPNDPELASALARVAEKEYGAWELVEILGEGRREPLLVRLEAAGILRREDDKVLLGLVPRRRWPALDSRHKDDLRRHLGDVLVRRLDPDPRTAGLITLLNVIDGLGGLLLVDRERTPVRQFVSRIKEVADGSGWAANEAAGQIKWAQQ